MGRREGRRRRSAFGLVLSAERILKSREESLTSDAIFEESFDQRGYKKGRRGLSLAAKEVDDLETSNNISLPSPLIPSPSQIMTRTDHFPFATPNFPIYSAAFVTDREVVFGGGGGASRSGVKNKLVGPSFLPFPSTFLPRMLPS